MMSIAYEKKELKPRDLYLNQLIAFQDSELVKVIFGIRRCGKSSLMKLMIKHLQESGISDEQIIEMNFESMQYRHMDVDEFYEYVKSRCIPGRKMYLFFDEIQRLTNWQDAVNSFRVDLPCDIYITGSNAYLLSSEYSTYLAGRHVEIKMLPLSFKEFIEFNKYEIKDQNGPAGIRKIVCDSAGKNYEIKELFDAYLKFGGMPGIADTGLVQERAFVLLEGIYSTVVVRDILEREKLRGQRQISDPNLLRKIIMFIADNIGNITSVNSIGNTLTSEGLIGKEEKPATKTVQVYINALLESYILYEIKRFDIKGRDYLRTLSKYYIVDIGLRNYLLGYRDIDRGHILENIVYFELLRRGYDVAVGKIRDKEIDFIATKVDDKRYIQVTESMNSPETRKREMAPLLMIPDNYEKIVITPDSDFQTTQEGIKIINLFDFLLSEI